MKPYYQDNHITQYCMDFRENDLPDESVQMVVTSPPYWGLRKYSGEQDLIWGGDKDCGHEWVTKDDNAEGYTGRKRWQHGVSRSTNPDGFCSLCGAWKGAYGLEPTPDCGRPFMKLRDDLTSKQRKYIIEEMKRLDMI